jgi:hypothetical protein
MANADHGTIIFKDNKVPKSLVINTKILDLSKYNNPENVEAVKAILTNERFVKIEGNKIIWKGKTDKNGYAIISTKILPYRPEGEKIRTIRLHRLVQELINGGAQTNAYVCHRSDEPSDINPKNLFNGTPGNNSIQVILHNRRFYPTGDDHWSVKIKDEQIATMIHLHYANAMTIKDLAATFGISVGHASRLINGHLRQYITLKAIKAASVSG